jgi:hypothetical protein
MAFFIGFAVYGLVKARRLSAHRQLLHAIGLILVLYSGAGFFGSGFMAGGGSAMVDESFEWPFGTVSGVLKASDGTLYAPHEFSGRIQAYDAERRFLRGWSVDAGGGAFKARLHPGQRIEVVTARRDKRLLYDRTGHLLREDKVAGNAYRDFDPGETHTVSFPLPFYLWVFTHPFNAMVVIPLGLLLTVACGPWTQMKRDRREARKSRKRRVSGG